MAPTADGRQLILAKTLGHLRSAIDTAATSVAPWGLIVTDCRSPLRAYIETGGKAATDNACDDFRAVCGASNVTRHAPRALGPRTGQSLLNCSASCGDRIGCLAMDPFPGPIGHGNGASAGGSAMPGIDVSSSPDITMAAASVDVKG
jgi:hypothetical protein